MAPAPLRTKCNSNAGRRIRAPGWMGPAAKDRLMSVNVDNFSTEVIPEPEGSASGAPAPANRWEEAERARAGYARWKRDHSRTAAEGFDD
jgi:hypothetical protein